MLNNVHNHFFITFFVKMNNYLSFLADDEPFKNMTLPCAPSPCDPYASCNVYGGQIAMCDPCSSTEQQWNPQCHPQCLYNSDCPFNLACVGQKCIDPCPGSCGIQAECTVVYHNPICSCQSGLIGNPYEHCTTPKQSMLKL